MILKIVTRNGRAKITFVPQQDRSTIEFDRKSGGILLDTITSRIGIKKDGENILISAPKQQSERKIMEEKLDLTPLKTVGSFGFGAFIGSINAFLLPVSLNIWAITSIALASGLANLWMDRSFPKLLKAFKNGALLGGTIAVMFLPNAGAILASAATFGVMNAGRVILWNYIKNSKIRIWSS